MLKVINIRVRSLTPDRRLVSWEIEPTFEDPLDYKIRVLRSESAEGPYDCISDYFEDKYLFIDSAVDTQTRGNRNWYYKIEVTSKASGAVRLFGPSNVSPAPDLVATEMRRQAMLIYRTVAGRRCWLFPVRTFGQRCRNCFDPVTNQPIRTRCQTCYDTTWVRGYLSPIEVWVQFEPTPSAMADGHIRVEKMQNQVAHTGYYPDIKPLDLLVEPENRRWIVQRVIAPERLRARVRQTLILDEAEIGSVHYDVPVDYNALLSDDFMNPFLLQPSRTLGEGIKWS